MNRQRLLLLAGGLIIVAGLLAVVTSCGGDNDAGITGSRDAGDLVIAVNWGNSRFIPPDAVRIDVAVSGEGLREPVTATIQRPESQTVIRNLPVGFKQVFGEAKNSQGQTVARGSGNTRIDEGQRASVDIVMAEVTPGGGTVLVHTTRGGVPTNADFVAFQDGNGAWQVAQGTGGQYALNITDNDGRYGVAIVCVNGTEVSVSILHATRAELGEIHHECSQPLSQSLVTVSGAIGGLGMGGGATVFLGTGMGFGYPLINTYSLQTVPGTYDLIALRYANLETSTVDKVLIRRNVSATTDTTQDIDFNSAEAFAPEMHTVTVLGATGRAVGSVVFRSNGKTVAGLGWRTDTDTYPGIPTSKLVGNDFHLLSVTDYGSQGVLRTVLRHFKVPADITVSLPDAFVSPEVTTVATAPYARFAASWSAYPDAQAYSLSYHTPTAPMGRSSKRSRQQSGSISWFVALSANWLGANSSYTLPDFSALSGWNNTWGLPAGQVIEWSVLAVSSNRNIPDIVAGLLQQQPVDGLEIRQSGKVGNITP
ncbi:MAG: hypothetical protein KatS3mg022_1525 [Armatimonadota bacterium]|nr:MAG: hypothetical protein KatS3mg022_1525 [Armatimonadota bacterium]